ncbi:hypothetical protein J6590_004069 [Homalodisca vitripennis]|nr:hypothetical protein J6590_004069 [Homalodisca vitripennis]
MGATSNRNNIKIERLIQHIRTLSLSLGNTRDRRGSLTDVSRQNCAPCRCVSRASGGREAQENQSGARALPLSHLFTATNEFISKYLPEALHPSSRSSAATPRRSWYARVGYGGRGLPASSRYLPTSLGLISGLNLPAVTGSHDLLPAPVLRLGVFACPLGLLIIYRALAAVLYQFAGTLPGLNLHRIVEFIRQTR